MRGDDAHQRERVLVIPEASQESAPQGTGTEEYDPHLGGRHNASWETSPPLPRLAVCAPRVDGRASAHTSRRARGVAREQAPTRRGVGALRSLGLDAFGAVSHEAGMLEPDDVRPFVPGRADLLRELGVLRDAARSVSRLSALQRGPRGRGQSALFVPGFRTGDGATALFRRYLNGRGFVAHGWRLGVNHGRVDALLPRVIERAESLVDAHGGPVAMVGTSLGGVLAREVARDRPDLVRRVVTLGSPVVGGPKYTQAGLTYQRRGYDLDAIEAEIELRYRVPLQVPVTAIFSKDDGIVAWPACIDRQTRGVEHIEIRSTHVGLTFHADALLEVARVLARDEPGAVSAPNSRVSAEAPASSAPSGARRRRTA